MGRTRRVTTPVHRGVGGDPPFPVRGPITALRVLEHGFEVSLDPNRPDFRIGRAAAPTTDVQLPLLYVSAVHAQLTRQGNALLVTDLGSKNGVGRRCSWLQEDPFGYVRCPEVLVNAGDRFSIGGVGMLALDELTNALIAPLVAYCGAAGHDYVDHALECIVGGRMLGLYGAPDDDALELARTLHAHSIRRQFPCTVLDAIPDSEAEMEELCTRTGCGTVILDQRRPFLVPPPFMTRLASEHYHLWTIVIARDRRDLSVALELPFDFAGFAIGFSAPTWS